MKLQKKKVENNSLMLFYSNSQNKKINAQIKKVLNIIYQYHIRNKKIMFVNVPFFIIKNMAKIKKKINHLFIPENIWINGLITNQSACFYSLFLKKKKNPNIKFFLKFKNKSDLIVNFNAKNTNIENLIKESYNQTIPSISFNNDKYFNLHKPTYSIKKSFLDLENNIIFFFSILKAIFKKKTSLQKNFYVFDKNFYFKKKNYINKLNKKFNKNKNSEHLKWYKKYLNKNRNNIYNDRKMKVDFSLNTHK